ncbi:unnamed protein product [Calypogeia fissa]
MLTTVVKFGIGLVEFLGKLSTGIVAVIKQLVELLRKLSVVFETLKSRRFRVFLRILFHGLMWFLSACFMGILFNDISYLLQNDISYVEQNGGHMLLGTDISRATYSVLAIILGPYWTWNSWRMADNLHLPDRTERQFRKALAHKIQEELQSLFGADEARQIELEAHSNGSSQIAEDPGSLVGTSTTQVRPDVESGGGPSAAMTSWKTPKRFLCVLSVQEKCEKVSIELLQTLEPNPVLPGSKVLYKRFKVNPRDPDELDHVVSQIVNSMKEARNVDKDCSLQLGSFAIFKYTDAGPKMWILQEDWTPEIIDIRRQWTLLEHLLGRPAKWIIRGLNLQGATLRAATKDASEDFKVLIGKHENGVDIIICEETHMIQHLAPRFHEKLFISASKVQKVEEGMNLKLQSDAQDVERAYWVSVVDSLIPGRWIVIISTTSSLLGRFRYSIVWTKLQLPKLLSNLHISGGFYLGRNSVPAFFWSNQYQPKLRPWYKDELPTTLEGHNNFWSLLWILLEIYINVYLVYLFSVIFVLWWNLHFQAHAPPQGRQSFVTAPRSPGSESPRAVSPPGGVIQFNRSVWELHSPGGIPTMEIIFFPGLQLEDFSNSFWKTWLAMDDEHVVWPKEVLSTMFPTARILCISYSSFTAEFAGQTDKSDIDILGESLVHDIIQDRNHNIGQHCPVFLVGHSLGGTIIKQFVLSAYGKCDLFNSGNFEEDIDAFVENIRGVFYYAAPNGGSRIAELASQIPSSSPILELLIKVNAASERINEGFRQQRINLKVPSFAVAEGCKVHYGAFEAMVVEEVSAQLDVEQSYVHTKANHFTVCRAKCMEDVAIEKLIKFIAKTVIIPPLGVTEVGDKGHLKHSDNEELQQDPKESQPSTSQLPGVTKIDDKDELDFTWDFQETFLANLIPPFSGMDAIDEKDTTHPHQGKLGQQEQSLSGTILLPDEFKVDGNAIGEWESYR